MSELQIPKEYTEKKIIETCSWRRIEEYTCENKDLQLAYGRKMRAYYDISKPQNKIFALKQLCIVRIFHDNGPCYGFCQLLDGSTCLELYMSFTDELLSKVIYAHYGEVALKEFEISPGSPYINIASIFDRHCVILIPSKNQQGKMMGVNESMPVEYLHYY